MKTKMIRAAIAAICVAATLPSYADSSAAKLPYASTKYFMGASGYDTSAVLGETSKLAFPGATLDEIKALLDRGYIFGGHMFGSQANLTDRPHQASQVLVHTDQTTGAAGLIVASFMYAFNNKTMAASVELTNGVDGVYARIGRSQTKSGADASFVCATLDADGNVTYTCDSSSPNGATAVAVGSMGLCLDSLSIINSPNSSSATFLWPGATLEEIKDYDFTANICGTSYNISSVNTTVKGYNTRLTTDGEGNVTSIIVEFQDKPGAIRYVIVEFTGGEGGVYAKALCSGYIDRNVPAIGTPIVKDGGGYNGTLFGTPSYGLYNGVVNGYGVHSICAKPKQRAYSLAGWITKNSQKVWANGSGEAVLTLDDVKDHRLSAIINGKSIGKDTDALGYNKTFEYDENNAVKSMYVSYQFNDNNNWIKYVNVRFTNGVDGIYGYATGAGYIAGSLGIVPPEAGNFSVATSTSVDGYGAYNLVASPGFIQLDADTDWSSRGTISWDGTIVDLNGHSLTFEAGWNSSVFVSSGATIVNSAAGTVELHVRVPFGNTFNNNGLRFGISGTTPCTITTKLYKGDVRPIKEGGGTYVATVMQRHANPMEITAGAVKMGAANGSTPLGGDSKPVVVHAGGVLDMNGYRDYNRYAITLHGGELRNTGADPGYGNAQTKTVVLTDDSTFNFTGYGLIASGYNATTLNLGGHTLAVTASGTFYLYNTAITAGKVVVQGAGTMNIGTSGKTGLSAASTDFSVGCALKLEVKADVHDYEALYTGSSNSGTAALNVHGTFRPSAHDCFYGCTMTDGSTIDLSLRDGALPLVSSFTSGANTLQFATGAPTVYVKLGGKRFAGGKVISWNEKPENIDTVKFKNAPGERKRAFVAKDDGLYCTTGFVVFVK